MHNPDYKWACCECMFTAKENIYKHQLKMQKNICCRRYYNECCGTLKGTIQSKVISILPSFCANCQHVTRRSKGQLFGLWLWGHLFRPSHPTITNLIISWLILSITPTSPAMLSLLCGTLQKIGQLYFITLNTLVHHCCLCDVTGEHYWMCHPRNPITLSILGRIWWQWAWECSDGMPWSPWGKGMQWRPWGQEAKTATVTNYTLRV